MERGDQAVAKDLLLRAVQQGPTDVDARQRLAEVLWKSGAEDEALQHVDAAVRLAPHDANTLVWAGEMRLARGQLDVAVASAEAAIAHDQNCAPAWSLRGRARRRCNELELALADLQQSLRYNPQAPEVLLESAELQYQLGRPERCLTTLHRLLDIYSPGDEPRRALWLEGLAFQAIDRPSDAVASLYAASQRGDSQPDLLYQLAVAQQAMGDLASARATAREALSAQATHEPSQLLLAQLSVVNDAAPGNLIRR